MSENDDRKQSARQGERAEQNEHAGASRTETATVSRKVRIPERTAERIEARIDGTEFESVDGYVSLALELLLRQLDPEDGAVDGPEPDEPSESEEVRDRLEQLGYL